MSEKVRVAVRAGSLAVRGLVAAAALGAMLMLAVAFFPTLFGYGASVVESGSMDRALPIGSVAQTKMVPASEIRVGDVVSFRRAGAHATVAHRVIEIGHDGERVVLRTKGDASAAPDPHPIVVRDRIARVERVIPFAGYVAHFSRTRTGWIVLFLAPLAGLLLEQRRLPWAPGRPARTWRQSPAA